MVGTHTIGYLMVGAHNLHVCHLVTYPYFIVPGGGDPYCSILDGGDPYSSVLDGGGP